MTLGESSQKRVIHVDTLGSNALGQMIANKNCIHFADDKMMPVGVPPTRIVMIDTRYMAYLTRKPNMADGEGVARDPRRDLPKCPTVRDGLFLPI